MSPNKIIHMFLYKYLFLRCLKQSYREVREDYLRQQVKGWQVEWTNQCRLTQTVLSIFDGSLICFCIYFNESVRAYHFEAGLLLDFMQFSRNNYNEFIAMTEVQIKLKPKSHLPKNSPSQTHTSTNSQPQQHPHCPQTQPNVKTSSKQSQSKQHSEVKSYKSPVKKLSSKTSLYNNSQTLEVGSLEDTYEGPTIVIGSTSVSGKRTKKDRKLSEGMCERMWVVQRLRKEHCEEQRRAEGELGEVELRRLRKMHTVEEAQCMLRVLEEEDII